MGLLLTAEQALAASMLLPAIGSVGVALTGRKPNLREGVTLITAVLTFLCVLRLLGPVNAGATVSLNLFEIFPGVSLAFLVEPLGMTFALVASGLWILTSAYAIGYMRGHHEKNQTRFYVCFALAIFAALGAAFAQNMATLFVCYEVLTFSTYPLVTHHGTEAAKRAGRIYLGILVFTSVTLLLLAVIWTFVLTGTLAFTPGGILAGKASPALMGLLLGLYVFGTGKAAVMPFHAWLPNAMVAPTPVSALLHAVAVVKTGVFTVLKVVIYIFGIETLSQSGVSTWLMYVAAGTILVGSLIAMTKDNLKARLAYSTVSQLSYIVLGASLATAAGIVGGGMHIVMHAFGKITLFFCAGAIYVGAHKTEISDMDGLGRKMPFTYLAFFVGALSVIGLPPFGGSWSKWFLAIGAIDADQAVLVAVLMISSLLNIAYLMPVVARGFFSGEREAGEGGWWANVHEAPIFCVVPLCLTAVGCLALFFFAGDLELFLRSIPGLGVMK